MNLKSAAEQELQSFNCDFSRRIATVGTTARASNAFAVLPRRKALGFEAINFLVTDDQSAEELFQLLDKQVKYILVDIEMKKNIQLLSIAERCIRNAVIVTYKPNDTTLEAADFFLRHYFKDRLEGKKIAVYGAGNLGSKLALRLTERGAEVFLGSRNKQKVLEIIKALNHLLPSFSKTQIHYFNTQAENEMFDALISFTSASSVIPPHYIKQIKKEGLALDGGIDNFTKEFMEEAVKKEINLYRLDVRAAFPHSILYVTDYIKRFYTEIQGEIMMDEIRLVAGGIIGREGDVVVDRIYRPTQIVGLANGMGGLKQRELLSEQEINKLRLISQRIIKEHS